MIYPSGVAIRDVIYHAQKIARYCTGYPGFEFSGSHQVRVKSDSELDPLGIFICLSTNLLLG